ncbi:MAG: succinylglutamate desuccinylase/aspartoacylase family protein, partial [Woeseiaceae bacterium]|nr:succinylglutamate desuccinylase/aspartoacylase family protein [Woeseiaceae bacterium]
VPTDAPAAAPQETRDVEGVGLAEPLPPEDAGAEPDEEATADEPASDAADAADATEAAEPEPKAANVAENVDLSQPVDPDAMRIDVELRGEPQSDWSAPNIPPTYSNEQPALFLLDTEIPASTSARLAWSPEQSFDGIAMPTPVLVVNGAERGPVVCLTAAVHGDELNGIEVVRRVMYDLDPEKLSGAVIGVPIVNLQGFRRGSRYLPDRRDLNRFFPGNPNGSLASRIAYSFFNEVISHCEALVDLHTGSFKRTNLPQLRADLRNPDVVELTRGFGSTVVLHSSGAGGTLRRAASDRGIPAVTLEAGEPARLQEKEVEHGTKGVMTLLNELGMYRKVTFWGSREPVYYRSTWVRADRGGVLFSKVELGERVTKNQVLGTITDPITNVQSTLRASSDGRVLGMALNQFVMPGFAAFRIGIEAPEAPRAAPADSGEASTHTALNEGDPTDGDGAESEAEEADEGIVTADEGDDLENSE